jgi:hypothetical protein
MRKFVLFAILAALLAGCRLVPGTGDSINDAASADRFVPQSVAGYTVTDATSISDALTKAGIAGSTLSGNVPLAGVIAKLDGMIQCYKSVGAVSARVYTEQNPNLLGIPKIGALAVVNTTRLGRNFLQCALNTGVSAQAVDQIQPCGGSGQKIVNNETLEYVYASTAPELCAFFQSQFN